MHKNNKKLGLKVGFLLEKNNKPKTIKFRPGRDFVLTCLMEQLIRRHAKFVIVHKTL